MIPVKAQAVLNINLLHADQYLWEATGGYSEHPFKTLDCGH